MTRISAVFTAGLQIRQNVKEVRQNIRGVWQNIKGGVRQNKKRSPAEHKGFLWGTEGICVGGLKEVRKAGKFKERTAE